MTIDSRFHDLGFGSKEIDLTNSPNDKNLLDYSNNGFGSKSSITNNSIEYKNSRELNFASKDQILSKQDFTTVEYDDLMKTGSFKVKKHSFYVLKTKNIFKECNVLIKPQVMFGYNENFYFERISKNSIKVFNTSKKDMIFNYVLSKNNKKYNKINDLENISNIINNNIKESLIVTSQTSLRYDESSLQEKNIDKNLNSSEGYVSSITLNVKHIYVLTNPGSILYSLNSLVKNENSFFTFVTPDNLNETVDIASTTEVYLLSDINDHNSATLQPHHFGGGLYGITLESNKTYYFWFEVHEDAWYVSTENFPSITIYN